MDQDDVLIESLSIGGYRSFGNAKQRFDKFCKVNLFIGRNNSGKSNIFRFIHDVYYPLSRKAPISLDRLDNHIPPGPMFSIGLSLSLEKDEHGNFAKFASAISPLVREERLKTSATGLALRVFQEKAKVDGTTSVWCDFNASGGIIDSDWDDAFGLLGGSDGTFLFKALTGESPMSGDVRHFNSISLNILTPKFKSIKV